MPHRFLSPEWIDEVRAIRDEYQHLTPSYPAPAFRANLVVTDMPFGERRLHAHAIATDGRIDVELGHLPEPDVTVTLDYEQARVLVVDQDPEAVAKAWIFGKIRVDGDLTRLLPTTDTSELVLAAKEAARDATAAEIGDRIRAATLS